MTNRRTRLRIETTLLPTDVDFCHEIDHFSRVSIQFIIFIGKSIDKSNERDFRFLFHPDRNYEINRLID